MKLIQCDKCGTITPLNESGLVITTYGGAKKGKGVELCEVCLAEVEELLGVKKEFKFPEEPKK